MPEMIWRGGQIVSVLAGDQPASPCLLAQMAICAGGQYKTTGNTDLDT